ncbi:hypothetical protein D3C78_1663240 [compost metagenome]
MTVIQRQLIEPCDKQIGTARELIVALDRIAIRKQENNVKIINIACKLHNENRSRREQHKRNRNNFELLKARCPVNIRRFIQVLWNRRKYTKDQHHRYRNPYPHIYDNNRHFCPERVR